MIKVENTMKLDNYNQLFDLVCELDSDTRNGKIDNPICFQKKKGNWSFAVYSPDHVNCLGHGLPEFPIDTNFQKAYTEDLELLEICTGDYENPEYIALTPDVDLDELKKQWIHSYCSAHGLAIEDYQEVSA